MVNQIFKQILLSVSIVFCFLMTSCLDQKKITYFQPKTETGDSVTSEMIPKYILRLKSGNIINVSVSSISPDANIMFNPHLLMQQTGYQSQQTNNIAPAIGYMVDDEGDISLPMVGKVKVANLTIKQSSDLIVQKLEKYLINPTVNVRMLNYSVSVMGEVGRPSVYTISNESITLPEILSLAGDLTIYARRDNVLVIRGTNGKREFTRVDLTQRDIFNSPVYYLQPNDVVYVEPVKGKATATDRTMQLAPTVMSGISLLVVLLSIVFK